MLLYEFEFIKKRVFGGLMNAFPSIWGTQVGILARESDSILV